MVIFVGVNYLLVTATVTGAECNSLAQAAPETVWEDRRRSEQRLSSNFDLRPDVEGASNLSCTVILGEGRCDAMGPILLDGQMGYLHEPVIYDIAAGQSAVIRINKSQLFCVLPDA